MASLPFVGPAIRHRKPLTGARMIIVASAAAFAMFLLWASLAQVDEVTAGEGKVIPSSKLQVITAADPATVSELLVRSGQRVHKGQLLARLDSPENESQLGQLQAETESLQARAVRLSQEGGMAPGAACEGSDCAGQEALRAARESALRSKVAAAQATADQARRDAAEAAATINSLQGTLALAQKQVQMMAPLAAKNIVPETDLIEKQREVVDIQGRIAAAREQQGKAMAAVREAQAQASQAGFEFKQQALDERSQVKAKIAVTSNRCSAPKGRPAAPKSIRRSTESSTTSRSRRSDPMSSRARRSWKSFRSARSCWSKRG